MGWAEITCKTCGLTEEVVRAEESKLSVVSIAKLRGWTWLHSEGWKCPQHSEGKCDV
jgi:hypothetical protein